MPWWRAVLAAQCSPDRSGIWLVVGVLAWWLVVVEVIGFTVPAPESGRPAASFAPGELARIHRPGQVTWPIPVDRATYYEHDRPMPDDDWDGLLEAGARQGWVVVRHGQDVRVLDVDRAAVRIELLASPSPGLRGWLKADYLRPYKTDI
jgi:hypothetical protein